MDEKANRMSEEELIELLANARCAHCGKPMMEHEISGEDLLCEDGSVANCDENLKL